MRSVASRRRLNGAILRSDAIDARSALRHLRILQKATALMPIISSRCATRLQMPQPRSAIATATAPLMSDEKNTIFERSAKRNSRVNITVCTTQRALIGSTKNSTGATVAIASASYIEAIGRASAVSTTYSSSDITTLKRSTER